MNSAEYCLDANIFITAWGVDYPEDIFPSLWEKLSARKGRITVIQPIFDEIQSDGDGDEDEERTFEDEEKRGKYPVRMWLEEQEFISVPVDDKAESKAASLRKKYGTRERPRSRGANLNDIRLIAYAK